MHELKDLKGIVTKRSSRRGNSSFGRVDGDLRRFIKSVEEFTTQLYSNRYTAQRPLLSGPFGQDNDIKIGEG